VNALPGFACLDALEVAVEAASTDPAVRGAAVGLQPDNP
jgi:hypothetical protein